MAFDNPQENDGRNEEDPQGSGGAGLLLRMMDPQIRQAAEMSADPASEGGDVNLPGREVAPDEAQADSAGAIGNRIVEIPANVPGVIPRQSAVRDDAAAGAPPDLRVVDAQRAQSSKDLPSDLFRPSSSAPVLAQRDATADAQSDAIGPPAKGETRTSGDDMTSAAASGAGKAPESPATKGPGPQAASSSNQAGAGRGNAGSSGSVAKSPGEKPTQRSDNFYAYATLASKLPAENRGVYLTRLHDVLTQSFLRSGKMVGPDGKVYSAESPRQADALVKRWVEDAMQDYREANPYGTRTTPLPPEQKPKWEDKHWILSGLKNSIPEFKKLPEQALHTLGKQMSFEEHKPGEKPDPNMLPDPANLLDDKHWIMKGLMHTVYDPNRNANDVVRAAGRGLDPLVNGLTGGVVDLRHGELHRPGRNLARLAGAAMNLPPGLVDRIYAATPEHTKSLWDTAHGDSIYGKDTDLNIDLRDAKKATGPAGSFLLPDEFNVQRGFDALGKATGEFVRDKGIGKAVNGAIQGSEILKKVVENPKAREILRTILKEATTSALGNAAQTDIDEEGKQKENIALAALKGAGRGLFMEGRMRGVRPTLSNIGAKKAEGKLASKIQNIPGAAALADRAKEMVHKESGPAMAALMAILKEARKENKEESGRKP